MLRHKLATVSVLLLSSSLSAVAIPQASKTKPASGPRLAIGMTEPQVAMALGEPVGCYAPEAGREFPLDECGAVFDVYSSVFIVYTRKTQKNEYEVRVHYMSDLTHSRLHPTVRMDAAVFLVDHPEPLPDLLRDNPELRALCSARCHVYADSVGEAAEIALVPQHPTQEQTQTADGASGQWEGGPGNQPNGCSSLPALTVSLDSATGLSLSALRERPIGRFRLDVFSPGCEQRLAIPSAGDSFLDLGLWP